MCEGSCRPWRLRPFPTRRSSDLAYRVSTAAAENKPYLADITPSPRAAGASPLLPITALQRRGAGRDRKSTRLNSSHVSISYAVFCLKKKTSAALHLLPLPPAAVP